METRREGNPLRGRLCALGAVAFWGVSFVATKVALREMAPGLLVWVRCALGLGVFTLAARSRGVPLGVPREHRLYLGVMGFLGIPFHLMIQTLWLRTVAASSTAWIVAVSPALVALLGWAFLRERLSWRGAGGIALAMGGVLLVAGGGGSGGWGLGDALVFLSAWNWAVFCVASRRGLRALAPAHLGWAIQVCGWIASFPLLLLPGCGLGALGALSPQGWGSVLFLGLGCSGLAYALWYDALRELPVAQAGAFQYLQPLLAGGAGWLLLGERPTGALLAGGAAILTGIVLLGRSSGSR